VNGSREYLTFCVGYWISRIGILHNANSTGILHITKNVWSRYDCLEISTCFLNQLILSKATASQIDSAVIT